MNYERIMQDLGGFLGLPGLMLAASGACTLAFDDIYVDFSAPGLGDAADVDESVEATQSGHDVDAMLEFSTRLGTSELDDVEQLQKILCSNLPGAGISGASLGVTDDGEVVLRQRIRLKNLNLERMTDRLEQFVNYAGHWRKELRADPTNHQTVDAASHMMDASMRA